MRHVCGMLVSMACRSLAPEEFLQGSVSLPQLGRTRECAAPRSPHPAPHPAPRRATHSKARMRKARDSRDPPRTSLHRRRLIGIRETQRAQSVPIAAVGVRFFRHSSNPLSVSALTKIRMEGRKSSSGSRSGLVRSLSDNLPDQFDNADRDSFTRAGAAGIIGPVNYTVTTP